MRRSSFNGNPGGIELTAHSVELELQQPFAYSAHVGIEPFLGRISTPATYMRLLACGKGALKEEFEQHLESLADRFASVLIDARKK